MDIGPTSPTNPAHRQNGQSRQEIERVAGETSAEKSRTTGLPAPQAVEAGEVEEKTREVAELIRERRASGFYHRTDVLRDVVSRLLESKDLDRIAIVVN